MDEMFKGKKVVDLTNPKPTTREFVIFTAAVLINNKMTHYIVKGESALDVLQYVQEKLKSPVMAVYPTEYWDYIDSTVPVTPSTAKKG